MFKQFQWLVVVFSLSACASGRPETIQNWAIYYDHQLPARDFAGLDLVVFDRNYYPDFQELKDETMVLAYVSLGEIHGDAPEKAWLEANHRLLAKNSRWNSHVIDITTPEWSRLVLDHIDDAAQKGFDGVMLDTVDSPIDWAQTEAPERRDSMRKAAVTLIHRIRLAHPGLKIMLNRGFDILPDITTDIDLILAESIMTNTNVSTGQFGLFPTNTYTQAAIQLHDVVALAPHLHVLTLDYWNQDDGEGIERIYAAQRAEGFMPYVTTPDLRTFTPEPHL